MKKTIAILLALVTVLSLGACGKQQAPEETPAPTAAPTAAPTPKPTPTPAPTPEPTEEPAFVSGTDLQPYDPIPASATDLKIQRIEGDHVTLVPCGEEWTGDLDGDGTEDTVNLWFTGYGTPRDFEVNGTNFADAIGEDMGIYFDAPDTRYFAITDLDESDDYLEIAVMDRGPSDDYATTFFRYEAGELKCLGSAEGLLYYTESGSFGSKLDGKGGIRSRLRLNVVQTWFADCEWRLNEDGVLAPVKQDVYENAWTNQEVTLLVPLLARPYGGGDSFILAEGDTLLITGTNNESLLFAKTADGKAIQINILDGYWLEEPDDSCVESWNAMEGLSFAD